jgi:TolB protein
MKFYRYFIMLFVLLFASVVMAQTSVINRTDIVGKIAYIGSDSNVYTLELTDGITTQLTEDGRRSARYEFPTWSRDGQLAYFCCSGAGMGRSQLSVHISNDAMSPSVVLSEASGERHVYAYWSPIACDTTDCVDLSVLVQDFRTPFLRVDLYNSTDTSEAGRRNLGQGTPFYFSWSPDGEAMVIHRNNNALQYYMMESSEIVDIDSGELGNFLSPAWSPVDDRILFATQADDNQSQLTVLDNDVMTTIGNPVDGVLSFSWSPDGKFIAYRYVTSDAISPVYVIDAETGDYISQSNVSGVFAFFWSPDSQKIAYVTLSNLPGSFDIRNDVSGGLTAYMVQDVEGFSWNILHVEDNTNMLLNSFVPTNDMQYLFTNFDQFAQSHRIWSPDSRYIVYSEVVNIDVITPQITLLDTSSGQIEPIYVADGLFAVWSFE